MNNRQKFRHVLSDKIKDLNQVIFHRLEAGILENKNRTIFTEDGIDAFIEIRTTFFKKDHDLETFSKIYYEKVNSLKDQIYYALDKGIIDNNIYDKISEGNIVCFFKIKTKKHTEQQPSFIGVGEITENEKKNDDAEHMTI